MGTVSRTAEEKNTKKYKTADAGCQWFFYVACESEKRRIGYMDYAKALEVVHALADGADPSTGERLEQNDIFNYPDIIRALSKAEEA
ncbi:MAG: hypothetical protein GF404_10355 [candidate division Zixibacteria bacterium]|nr:hypothetical protein [candidate division Zixibacteria bacterium]